MAQPTHITRKIRSDVQHLLFLSFLKKHCLARRHGDHGDWLPPGTRIFLLSCVCRSSRALPVCVCSVRACSSSKLGRWPFGRTLYERLCFNMEDPFAQCDSTLEQDSFFCFLPQTEKVDSKAYSSRHPSPR